MAFNPTPHLSAIGRLDIGGETAFGDETANYDYLQSFPVDLSGLTIAAQRNEHMRTSDYEVAKIIGGYRGTVTTKHYFHGHDSSLPTSYANVDSTQAGATAFDHILAIVADALGQYSEGGYTATGVGGNSTTATATSTSSFGVGEAVAWNTDDDILPYYVAWAKTNAANTITLLQSDPPHTSAAAATPILYGGFNVWTPSTSVMDPYANNASNSHANGAPATSWTIKCSGHKSDDQTRLYGCRPMGIKWDFPIGGLPTYEVTWGVSHWEAMGTGGAPSVGTYAFPDPESCLAWYCAWGSSAATSLQLKNLNVDIGLTRSEIADGSQPSGVGGYFTTKRDPTVSFSIHRSPDPSSAAAEVDYFVNQTGLPFTFQHGTQPGKMFALCIPNCRVLEYPAPSDDGAVMSNVTLGAGYYAGDTGSGSEITAINSAFRIALI